ncbi:family 2 encapsulin nanocompartment cargo protein polyprenyl transferase [Sphaerisporangium sp. TRM90804]|uniref:family 2 encapsulin nanocompartment cargo protein polyprenyl transferase n=1 Tax=Sphaerisporangium sp. TRM90804 TaxID=3031113 RepID=UPI00244AB60A|nr:family 2 encapsulin nanocompartment cargo protein polyprenyl transferase [Sphaerisporangium sp. TRM90804]MDH2429020.1 family 2 encapsulin nanocompartment cargo protein polyprenyl transferase [Sphaerisporangium sp. TRM90804]
MTTGRPVREVLHWSRDTVGPALRTAVETLPPSMRRVAGYHFGWLDQHGEPAEGDGGKAIRPALLLLAAEALGGRPETAMPAAVAVELVHNFSLLHDDVMDGDVTRRHRPTVWSVFGVSKAILAGDALLTLAFDVLASSGHQATDGAARVLGAAVLDLVEGQSSDTAFESRDDVTLAECVSMAEGKTGALLGSACALGALLGGGDAERVEHLRRFGDRLGLAFQLVDDLLGIWGDPEVTGKPVYSDVRSRKKSLPVVAALTSGTAAGERLAELYRREPAGADLEYAAELIEQAGGRAWTQARAADLFAEAQAHLTAAAPAPRPAAELQSLARLITHRDH